MPGTYVHSWVFFFFFCRHSLTTEYSVCAIPCDWILDREPRTRRWRMFLRSYGLRWHSRRTSTTSSPVKYTGTVVLLTTTVCAICTCACTSAFCVLCFVFFSVFFIVYCHTVLWYDKCVFLSKRTTVDVFFSCVLLSSTQVLLTVCAICACACAFCVFVVFRCLLSYYDT